MKYFFLTFHSLRFSKLSQLLWRLFFIFKRKTFEFLGPRHLYNLSDKKIIEKLSTELPNPIFKPRKEFYHYNSNGNLIVKFLNNSLAIRHPIDWHPAEWSHGTHLEELNLHYMEYLEGVDNKNFQEIICDWINQCPPYEKIYWLSSWNSFALSIRSITWMQQFSVRIDKLDNEKIPTMLSSLFEQILFLEKNLELDIGGNHLVKNIKTLLWASKFFNCKESERWKKRGTLLLKKEIHEQILSDGVHYERSPSYHLQVLCDFIECFHVLEESELKRYLKQTINKMIEAAQAFTHPDGKISLFNDSGLDMSRSPDEITEKWKELTGFKTDINHQYKIFLPDAGYYGIKKDNNYFIIDCGKIGPDFLPGHGHGDILSFEWDYMGKRIFIDSGVYEYHEGEMREYSRSTAAHSTVTINNDSQCEFWKSFRVGRRAQIIKCGPEYDGNSFSLTGYHDGFKRLKGSPIHQRSIKTDSETLIVNDYIKKGSGQNAFSYLILHPECKVERKNGEILISRNNIKIVLQTEFDVKKISGWWMPNFGIKEKNIRLVIDYGKIPCRGSFVLKGVSCEKH